ncbi:MAG TPA: hypothetical protein VMW20_00490 [Candidatus Nanoarchaeia archaeon]|nr:hypothetical protein [Candidatus Nanoarchaeia archaeon]
MATKNLCGKTRPNENPYEIWISRDGTWQWRVLKKYKAPESEAKDPYARWFCAVKSPYTYGSFELGDTYCREIYSVAYRLTPEEMAELLKNAS